MGSIGKTVLKAATGKGGIAGLAITIGLSLAKMILSKKETSLVLNISFCQSNSKAMPARI